MVKNISLAMVGLLVGIFLGLYFFYFKPTLPQHTKTQRQVIGFLPYWLLDKAYINNYASTITTLAYFSLTVDKDGHIVKLANEQQEDPGWHALHTDKISQLFSDAKKNNIKLSLVIDSGDSDAINQLLVKPVTHANNLIADIKPIMHQYGFTDVNLDIEYTADASPAAQAHFAQFIKTAKQQIVKNNLGTLTIETSPIDVVSQHLINLRSIQSYTDAIVIMAYDYHSPTSFVTGPVAPLYGAGVNSEYDVATAVEKASTLVPAQKVIVGVPLYGYEWETLSLAIRSAIIPGTGVLASNNRIVSLLSTCATCSAFFDTQAQEEYAYYKDPDTGTFHQISFPTQQSLAAKLNFANKEDLGGIALWALGYEGNDILSPLTSYKEIHD